MTPHGGHGVHEAHASHRGHGTHGHDQHAGHSVAMFRDTFWVSLLLTLPALAWGHMLQRAFSYHAPVIVAANAQLLRRA